MVTRPTPVISLSRCASNVSAMSESCRSETWFDVMASVMIGTSAGLTFEYTGG
jgi:hypothetical protein